MKASNMLTYAKYFAFACLLCLFLPAKVCFANSPGISEIPSLYQGRIQPFSAAARKWLYDHYHASHIKQNHLEMFRLKESDPIELALQMDLFGYAPWIDAPLFWIQRAELKKALGLNIRLSRFSSRELHKAIYEIENKPGAVPKDLLQDLNQLQNLLLLFSEKGIISEKALFETAKQLRQQDKSAPIIAQTLESKFPLMQRLKQAGSVGIKLLPGKNQIGLWYSLQALKAQVYDPVQDRFIAAGNFTAYSDTSFEAIRNAYLSFEQALLLNKQADEHLNNLSKELISAYKESLENKIFINASGKTLYYPSTFRLKLESAYFSFPWIITITLIYLASLILLIKKSSKMAGVFCFTAAFILHTALLVVRCIILQRPPVSNMFETILYVPWVSAAASIAMNAIWPSKYLLTGASACSVILLLMLEFGGMNHSLDPVQPVLDSQFWLTIHVLLVVGSYGIFLLGALFGHLYLAANFFQGKRLFQEKMGGVILQSIYIGTALLVCGTILGGVWAAESWGRFWDWDPKESWAFISCCIYLIWIHAYRFGIIKDFGLAVGAVIGFLAISFTWYGVNYILGTGLHSYGFGSGGEFAYYAFLGADILFLAAAFMRVSVMNRTIKPQVLTKTPHMKIVS